MPDRELRDHEMLRHEPELKRRIRSGMHFIKRCSEHGDGAAASLERLFVSRVDSGGESADDHRAVVHQSADESFDAFTAGKRGLSRADHRHARRSLEQREIAACESCSGACRRSDSFRPPMTRSVSSVTISLAKTRAFSGMREKSLQRGRRTYRTPAVCATAAAIDSQM
jgi:hypothetical protein